jgi:hypothetical protein
MSILPTLLSLLKNMFPKLFEFVGIDICSDGNRSAMSKHQLLEHWPQPEIVNDVAKIVGFAQFYSKFIPLSFKLCHSATKSQSLNTRTPSNRTRLRRPKTLLMT